MGKRKKSGKKPASAPLNFVHVHGLAINKGGQHPDAKREAKRGKRKHKADWARTNGLYFCFFRRQLTCMLSVMFRTLLITLDRPIYRLL